MFAIRSTLAALALVTLMSGGTALAKGAGPEGARHTHLADNAITLPVYQNTSTSAATFRPSANSSKPAVSTIAFTFGPKSKRIYRPGQ